MERWFLAGAVTGLLILLFDKPLAAEIRSEVLGRVSLPAVASVPPTPILQNPPTMSGCEDCGGSNSSSQGDVSKPDPNLVTVAPPVTPWTTLQAPGQPQSYKYFVKATGAAAGAPVPISGLYNQTVIVN